jgi:hypothetical protein
MEHPEVDALVIFAFLPHEINPNMPFIKIIFCKAVINRREIVSTESGPLSLILSPNPGGRVRGCSRQYKYATLNNEALGDMQSTQHILTGCFCLPLSFPRDIRKLFHRCPGSEK